MTDCSSQIGARVAFTIAGAVAGSLAMEAEGAVIYSGLQNEFVGAGDSFTINLDGGYQNTLFFNNFYAPAYDEYPAVRGQYAFMPSGNDALVVASGTILLNLPQSTLIGASSSFASDFGTFSASYDPGDWQFTNVNNAFFGFRFEMDSNMYYGWVRVDVDSTANTILIHDWAYESSPGVAIEAGATVPEPSSLALLTMGSAAGIAAMRRRRA